MINKSEVWSYPKDDEIFDDQEEEYTIFNTPDPKQKKLEYYIFRDEKVITEEVSKMYYHVITTLFAKSPTTFLMSELRDTIGITTDSSIPRSPYAINDSYFMEVNIGNNAKFRRLKLILQKFEWRMS